MNKEVFKKKKSYQNFPTKKKTNRKKNLQKTAKKLQKIAKGSNKEMRKLRKNVETCIKKKSSHSTIQGKKGHFRDGKA